MNKVKSWLREALGLTAVLAAPAVLCGSEMISEPCSDDVNLFLDPDFTQVESTEGLWMYSQHAGEPSFSLVAQDGELEIRRIGDEPWMLLTQIVSQPSMGGSTMRFSAELKADAPAQPPIHGFSHRAGLYLKVGNRRDAILADHEPNNGVWDWQTTVVEKVIPQGVTKLSVGFVHQSGGVLWIRKPELKYVGCPAQKKH